MRKRECMTFERDKPNSKTVSVTGICAPNTDEVESRSSRKPKLLDYYRVQGHPGLHEILSQKKTTASKINLYILT